MKDFRESKRARKQGGNRTSANVDRDFLVGSPMVVCPGCETFVRPEVNGTCRWCGGQASREEDPR